MIPSSSLTIGVPPRAARFAPVLIGLLALFAGPGTARAAPVAANSSCAALPAPPR